MATTSISSAIELELAHGRCRDASDVASPVVDPEAVVLRLFDLHAPRLRSYVCRCGLTSDAADDVVQDAFLALFRHLQKGGNADNLPGWLVQVSFRLALKARYRATRRWSREQALEDAAFEIAEDELSAEAELVARERRRTIVAVVRALPERDQQCLWMRAEGVTYRDIARTLGISLGSVAKAVSRAAVRLSHAVKV